MNIRQKVRFNPGVLKPVSKITDRAKRYRAHHPDVAPAKPKRCGFCGSGRNVVPHHINGVEDDGEAQNLMWACKSCNTKVGLRMKKAGLGKRTRQYNPGRRARGGLREQLKEYGAAIKVMRGEWDGDVSKAVATIYATPRDVRSAYTAKTWPVRRHLYGRAGRQMPLSYGDVPF